MTSKKIRLILFLFVIPLLFSGCLSFFNKKDFRYDLKINPQNSTFIQGKIFPNKNNTKPYYLILIKIEENNQKLVDFSSHVFAEEFKFNVIPGKYILYAIQEPMELTNKKRGHIFVSNEIHISTVNDCQNLFINVELSPKAKHLEKFEKILSSSSEKSIFEVISYKKRVDLNDIIFKDKNIRLGLWEPSKFLEEVGGGLYYINEYDKNKTPILFIHGISGSPRNFLDIIESIDKEKFQVLVYYYPTGVNLNYAVDILQLKLDKLKKLYQYQNLIVIAHSMGGLVGRGFINLYHKKINIQKFITLSTPWNGQKFAKLGGEDVGKIVASFGNIYPGSAYQKKILKTPLPEMIEHHLLFGYRGKKSIILDNSNDGVISLSSQLYDKVQRHAYKVYGFNSNHREILYEPKVISRIKTILEEHH